MTRKWIHITELSAAMRERARAGKEVKLSPKTALLVAAFLEDRTLRPDRFTVDMYKEGSAIYRLDDKGEIFQIDGWARSSLVGKVTFRALTEAYPDERFSQRRGSWVEADWPKR
jgi:hypothetical protein